VPRAAACITDQARIPFATIVVRTNQSAVGSIGPRGLQVTTASARGEQSGREWLTTAMVVMGWGAFASTRVPTTCIYTVDMRAPLDWHVKMVAPIGLVDMRDDQFHMCLCRFVELMSKAHHAKVGGEVSIIILGVVIVDAAQEHGDSINLSTFLDGLDECPTASPIIVIDPLLGL
jgi:hypothetical protein